MTESAYQAELTLLDITMSLARRCEDYEERLGNGTFEDQRAWLFVRTAEVVRKARRNQKMIREVRE